MKLKPQLIGEYQGTSPRIPQSITTLRLPLKVSGGIFNYAMLRAAILTIVLLAAGIRIYAVTLSVALDGSQAFTVIQEAINASAHSDTVLVYPGRYYENVRFNGKNITLASLELLTGNRDYVYSTIIDGNQNGAVITANNSESHIHIQGFTVINGTGYYDTFLACTFGGGVAMFGMTGQRKASIVNCDITSNMATNGGGLSGSAINLYLSGVSIHSNIASSGGGIWFYGLHPQPYNANFDPVNRCSIYSNYAAFGSDLYFYNVNSVHVVVDTFTVANPWNFYATAIASNPNISNPYTFDILNTVHEEVNHDLYVAPWGDDAHSGLSPAEPMQSIFMAMYRIASDSENPKSVHVADGRYSSSLNGQLFPITIKSHTRLIGESIEGTILDAEDEHNFLTVSPGSSSWKLQKFSFVNGKSGMAFNRSADFTLEDIVMHRIGNSRSPSGIGSAYTRCSIEITNLTIKDIRSSGRVEVLRNLQASGSLKLKNVDISGSEAPETRAITMSSIDECDILIDGLEVHNNRSTTSDMFAFNSMFQISPFENYGSRLRIEIKNSAFYDNYQGTNNHMAMARSLNDTLFISNCTFAGNSGGGSAVAVQGTNVLTNNIFYNPAMTTQILIPDYISSGIYSPTTLINNNILGGPAGVYSATFQNPVYWGAGNTDYDPLFVGEGNRPYTLSPVSPLIDAGWQAASGVISNSVDAAGNERYWDGDGDGVTVIDVGAYEYQPIYSPINLTCELSGQQIDLSWQMPLMDRGLSGFRIYRNDAAYVDISDPSTAHFRDYSAVNDTLTYYVVALYGNVESAASNTVTVIIDSVANADELAVPISGSISVAPNPFRDIAVISYEIPKQSEVELKLYNIRGQLVKRLFAGNQAKGEQVLAWDGCNDDARYLPAGVYLLRITVDGAAKKPLRILKL
ncbi:MAG: FlgD immunoglobulin-like domain containing protein [Candidatus Cloacimonadaceae bacterium]|jgi:hypothetical protein|nr:FlgD immunoglobulin-like domain containing protein [Candidatus Cloacimonadaceae bacterium]